jgi:glycosyltransferase involved in cell wall biosynthesis
LPKAVTSCYEPSLDIQIIVIDDGSTDGTWEWLQQQEDLVTIHQENMGKDWAVNNAFNLATGKYIRFLDSDDWILPGSSTALFEEAEIRNLDITCAGYQLHDERENLIKEINWTNCDDFIAQQLGECDSSHYSAFLFKKDFIADIPHRQEFGALDDRKFIIEAAIKQPKIGFINGPTLAHRVHDQPRLQKPNEQKELANHKAYLKIYQDAFAALQNTGQLTQRRKNAACNNLWHLAHWIAKNNIADGRKIYNWVYELNPQYKPLENKSLAALYKTLGFTITEQLLKLKRSIG